ncbi:MAG: prepilin-type N-terminal cleavage/methylation domain-containing protein [Candidatus Omnitrophota bacterium]
MKNGVTLIELMVAVALLGVILLTAATLDVAARKFFNASDRVAEMQCEVSPVLLRIKRDINQVTGSINDSGIFIEAPPVDIVTRLRFRRSDATWGAYVKNGTTIEYYSQAPVPPGWVGSPLLTEIVSAGVTDFSPTFVTGSTATVKVSITSCYDASGMLGLCGSNNNPQITLATSAHALSQSAR